jgi:hypothetical protein
MFLAGQNTFSIPSPMEAAITVADKGLNTTSLRAFYTFFMHRLLEW